jgi:hypothetical protein
VDGLDATDDNDTPDTRNVMVVADGEMSYMRIPVCLTCPL